MTKVGLDAPPVSPVAPEDRARRDAEIGRRADAAKRDADEMHLLQRVAARDRVAFEALYRSYFPRLHRFLGRLTRRPLEVEEVLNDTLLIVWDKAASFGGRSKVSTWIFGIAYRRALKSLRLLDEPLPSEDGTAPEEEAEGPEDRLIQSQLREVLMVALDRLSAEHRAVVMLTFFHGFAYSEIAQIVGCPVDTVKTRMFHARRRLRAMLCDVREDLP